MHMVPLPGVPLHNVTLQPAGDESEAAEFILVHGRGANMALWFSYIAPDLRGHGLSSLPSSGYTAQQMAGDLRHAPMGGLHVIAAGTCGAPSHTSPPPRRFGVYIHTSLHLTATVGPKGFTVPTASPYGVDSSVRAPQL
jgi:hypothetical protein